MSGGPSFYITRSTTLLQVDSSTAINATVYLSSLNTPGALITIRDIAGAIHYNSTAPPVSNNIITVSTTQGITFLDGGGPSNNIYRITQPYGFLTMIPKTSSIWGVLNTFAFPDATAAANIQNITASSITVNNSYVTAAYISTAVISTITIAAIQTPQIYTNNLQASSILASIITSPQLFISSIMTSTLTAPQLFISAIMASTVTASNITTSNLVADNITTTTILTSNIDISRSCRVLSELFVGTFNAPQSAVFRFTTSGGTTYIQSGSDLTTGSVSPLFITGMNGSPNLISIFPNGRVYTSNGISFDSPTTSNDSMNGAPSYGIGLANASFGLGPYYGSNERALQVANYYGINFVGGTSNWNTGSSHMCIVDAKVGIDNSNPSYPLDVTGDIRATGVFRGDGSGLTNVPVYSFVSQQFTAKIDPMNGQYFQIFQNTSNLTSGVPYLVTAEISFRRTGSSFDGSFFYFTNKGGLSGGLIANLIGIPYVVGYANNVMDLGGAGNPYGGSATSIRSCAQAVVTNGIINLWAYNTADDIWTYTVIVSAVRCNTMVSEITPP